MSLVMQPFTAGGRERLLPVLALAVLPVVVCLPDRRQPAGVPCRVGDEGKSFHRTIPIHHRVINAGHSGDGGDQGTDGRVRLARPRVAALALGATVATLTSGTFWPHLPDRARNAGVSTVAWGTNRSLWADRTSVTFLSTITFRTALPFGTTFTPGSRFTLRTGRSDLSLWPAFALWTGRAAFTPRTLWTGLARLALGTRLSRNGRQS